MTTIAQIRTIMTGFPGGPGVITLHTTNTASIAESVATMFSNLNGRFPSDVTFSVEGHGYLLEDTTGVLNGEWSGSVPAPVSGGSTAPYAAPAGVVVNWMSASFFHGRLARGKTFFVPAAGDIYQTDGSIAATPLAEFRSATTDFVGREAGGLCVWHRPVEARAADGSRPAVVARAGGHSLITSSVVNDRVAILRSRRD